MQILSIHLKNIKSHRDTRLSFSAGINVLTGPNGAGKSTIFEAIGYALFGVDARDFVSNVERFLTIGTKKGEISVVFRTGDGETWRVSRSVGSGAKWLLARELGGVFEVEDHAGMEETGARIAGLLGLDNGRALAEQFKLVIGPFQTDFLGPFVIRQPVKRQEAFDEILGIDAWRKTYKGTGTMLSAVQERIRVITAEVAVRQEQLIVLPERKSELDVLKASQAARQSQLILRQTELHKSSEQLLQLDQHKLQLETAEHAVKQHEASVASGMEHIASQRLLVEQSETAVTSLEQSRAGKEAFEKAEALLVELRSKEKRRRAMELDLVALDKEAQRLEQAYAHETGEIDRTGQELADEQARLAAVRASLHADESLVALAAELPEVRREADRIKRERALLDGRGAGFVEGRDKLEEGVCPFFQEQCQNISGKKPQDIFSAKIHELDRQKSEYDIIVQQLNIKIASAEQAQQTLESLKVRLEELGKQENALAGRRARTQERGINLEQLKKAQCEAAAQAAARKAELQVFARLDEEISRAEEEKNRYQAARDTFHASQKDAAELDSRRQVLVKYQKRLDGLQQELATLHADAKRLGESYQAERHQELRQEKERLVAEVATLIQQLEDMGRNRQRIEAEIAQLTTLEKELESKQAEIKTFEDKEKLVKFLRNQVFKNVSSQLSERFREEISLRADRIYRTIADSDEELYWGDNYQVVLRDMPEGILRERSDDQLSGGQMMSAVVALRLALLQTIGARVAFFDEPTSNLDAARRENLAHAFRAIDVGREEVTEHWYDQLFLISHDVSFTEITDQVIPLAE